MAKKTVASLQKKGAKSFTKAIKMVKNDRGNYSFKSEIVPSGSQKMSECSCCLPIIVLVFLSTIIF